MVGYSIPCFRTSDTFACSQTSQVFPPDPPARSTIHPRVALPGRPWLLGLDVGGFPSLLQTCHRTEISAMDLFYTINQPVVDLLIKPVVYLIHRRSNHQ